MNNNYKLKICIIIYIFLLSFIISIVSIFQTKNKYFRFGVPNIDDEPLIIVSVKIDNYYKYFLLLLFISIFRITKVILSEVADPILTFNIYNPDKKNISEFSKFELQFYANLFYFLDSIRYVFTIMIAITQFDIALFDAIIGEITSIFTIRMLLNEKTFHKNYINLDNEII